MRYAKFPEIYIFFMKPLYNFPKQWYTNHTTLFYRCARKRVTLFFNTIFANIPYGIFYTKTQKTKNALKNAGFVYLNTLCYMQISAVFQITIKCVVTLNLSRVFVRGIDLYHAFLFGWEVQDMNEYEEMYKKLFNKITDVIEELKEVQKQTEEMYINAVDKEEAPEG